MRLSITTIQFYLRLLILSIFVVFIAGRSQSQDTGGFEFFNSDEILEVTIKTDFKNLINNKKERKYQKAELIVNDISYSIRLKARGNFRLENCSFPPITLNFSETDFDDKSYEQLKKIKLVNACKMQNPYAQYILSEYLIYRAFNLMTDKSFRVKLLKIEYVDTNKNKKPVVQYGFVIEDQQIMADRLNALIIKKIGLLDQFTNKDQMVMLSIFQFMIGNTDWQVAGLHNIKLLKIKEVTEPTPYVIPYDFDFTGMVNASYAIPQPDLGIINIRERLYWGKCFSEEDLTTAIKKFSQNKEAIYQLYRNFTLLDKATLNQSINYLNSFYRIIEDEKRWKHYFVDNCKH